MYDWLKLIRENQSYSSFDKKQRPNSRIFTEEEDIFALNIFHNELAKRKCFCDMDAIEILTDAYIQKHADDEEFDTTFNVSNGYIYYFKIRHNFVWKLCHIKRRPSNKQIFIDNFINDIGNLLEKVDHSRIINIDETAIFLAPKNLKIWHCKGQQCFPFLQF